MVLPKAVIADKLAALRRVQVALGIAGFAALLAVVLAVSRSITRPLRRLDEATRALATGDLDAPVPAPRGNDEVARFPRRRDAERALEHIAGRLSPRKGPKVEVDSLHITVDNNHPRAVRQARGITRDYLAFQEGNHRRADGVLIRNRAAMKRAKAG